MSCGRMHIWGVVQHSDALVDKVFLWTWRVLFRGHPLEGLRVRLRNRHPKILQLLLGWSVVARQGIILHNLCVVVSRQVFAFALLENVTEHPQRGVGFTVERVTPDQGNKASRSGTSIPFDIVIIRNAELAFSQHFLYFTQPLFCLW